MKHFKEYLASKAKEGSSSLDPKESKAKMEMLNHLSDLMKDHMSSGLKKVTVASDSKQGLEKGLDKAKEVLDKGPSDSMDAEEASESEPAGEYDAEDKVEKQIDECDLSPQEIDELIAYLQEKKAKQS